jgi:hypothetical protein
MAGMTFRVAIDATPNTPHFTFRRVAMFHPPKRIIICQAPFAVQSLSKTPRQVDCSRETGHLVWDGNQLSVRRLSHHCPSTEITVFPYRRIATSYFALVNWSKMPKLSTD